MNTTTLIIIILGVVIAAIGAILLLVSKMFDFKIDTRRSIDIPPEENDK